MTNKPFYFIMLGGLLFFLALVFIVGVKPANDTTNQAPAEEVAFDPSAAATSCFGCHGGNLEGTAGGPSLIGLSLSADEVAEIIKNGRGSMPAGMFKGTDEEILALANWVLEHK